MEKSLKAVIVQAYLNYYMSGRRDTRNNLYKALSFLTPCTQAYRDLFETYYGVIWNAAYDNIDTSKTFADNVVIWADNCYSVDVTYNADCTSNGNAVDYADASIRIYFLQTGSGFVISSFACYFPVVLWAKKKPMVGMLMMPKTMAYIWMICMGLGLIGR